jgi:hypothetical protein
MSLVLRQVKGSKLTIQEGDNNFTYLEDLSKKNRPNVASFFDITGGAVTTFQNTIDWEPLVSTSQTGVNTGTFMTLVPDAFGVGNFGYVYQIPGVSGPVPSVFKFEVIASIMGGNAKDIQISIFRDVNSQGNPQIWSCSVQDTTTLTPGTKPVQLISHCLIGLLQNDTVSIFVRNLTDTSSIEVKSLNVIWSRYEL